MQIRPGAAPSSPRRSAPNVKDLNTAFDGVRYYSLAENKTALRRFLHQDFADVEAAAKNAKLLQADVTPEQMIDPSFVKAAQ